MQERRPYFIRITGCITTHSSKIARLTMLYEICKPRLVQVNAIRRFLEQAKYIRMPCACANSRLGDNQITVEESNLINYPKIISRLAI